MKRIVVVSGLSGSGKTLAIKSIEDMGYFTVDNLPVPLIPPFIDLLERSQDPRPQAAFAADARERSHLLSLPPLIDELRARADIDLLVLFFDASEETLVRRFSETRRPHPLIDASTTSVSQAIRREQQLLAPLRALADRVIETDELTPHELRRLLQRELAGQSEVASLHCHVVSFGFKHGAPREADMVFDTRFLANPFFVPALRELTGKDGPVLDYLAELPDYHAFIERLENLLEFVMPRFVQEGKSYLTLAIGCTGGRHRSVALAERVGRFLRQSGYSASVSHRDLDGPREEA
ncbi:MAG: RNase adapter RapZ [Acidobacteriota bacterium]|nr:MAG: RNase adapter RapZ [Acidobacteriota bacterium]